MEDKKVEALVKQLHSTVEASTEDLKIETFIGILGFSDNAHIIADEEHRELAILLGNLMALQARGPHPYILLGLVSTLREFVHKVSPALAPRLNQLFMLSPEDFDELDKQIRAEMPMTEIPLTKEPHTVH